MFTQVFVACKLYTIIILTPIYSLYQKILYIIQSVNLSLGLRETNSSCHIRSSVVFVTGCNNDTNKNYTKLTLKTVTL